MSKQARKITHGDELQDGIKQGLEELYRVAKACYGPSAGIALIDASYGTPLASRDGVSNLQKVHLVDRVQNMAARIAVQASKQNNQHVGDGTTAVVILAYHLYSAARKMIAGGYNPMEVARMLEDAALLVDAALDKLTEQATSELLEQVASIAAGDEAIGTMIAEVIKTVGEEGGVVIEDFAGAGIYPELVEGFFFNKGFTNVNLTNDPSNLESRYTNVPILVSDKRLATTSDIAPILDKVAGAGLRDLLIVGEVLEEAQGALMLMRLKGEITTTVVDAPSVLGGRSLFLDDLALVTGAKVFTAGATGGDFELDMLGAAEKVVITGSTTTIVGREGVEEDIAGRVTVLAEQLATADHPIDREAITSRIARLKGKLAVIRVGGATEIEQKEVKLRVQDSVCAVQAAARGGIVPGGGVALARVAGTSGIAVVYQQLFCELLDNAGVNPQAYLTLLGESGPWHGVDLGHPSSGLVDLKVAGVIDPALVVKETVKNATSVVVQLITARVGITGATEEFYHD